MILSRKCCRDTLHSQYQKVRLTSVFTCCSLAEADINSGQIMIISTFHGILETVEKVKINFQMHTDRLEYVYLCLELLLYLDFSCFHTLHVCFWWPLRDLMLLYLFGTWQWCLRANINRVTFLSAAISLWMKDHESHRVFPLISIRGRIWWSNFFLLITPWFQEDNWLTQFWLWNGPCYVCVYACMVVWFGQVLAHSFWQLFLASCWWLSWACSTSIDMAPSTPLLFCSMHSLLVSWTF